MHVAADLNWFLQFIVLALVGIFGLLYLVRNTASRYFVVDSNFDSSAADYSSLDRRKRDSMSEAAGGAAEGFDSCAVCGHLTKKQCAGCKMVKYCSEACQKSHWTSEHKTRCKEMKSLYKANYTIPKSTLRGRIASVAPLGGSSKIYKPSNKILFPYEEFLEFFTWDKPGYPPCGLLNCGNSCFANVVLQCLAYTRPLVAYLLEKGHRRECQRNDWCFLCEFQLHMERASRSANPFSPMNILSRLPNIGGNLGYGKQEDAHEFMRFAIDTMQSVCLDEFGGEKVVHPSFQETTLIQHIFGGRLRSQVICAECKNVSNQFENMMDLTVEIHGDAGSMEECLDQFTAKEWLHGDNMYKCDGCNAYVMAWKRLTVQRAPNILTIALKRFQSGRFGKLNKRVTFPETLDLSPYMSELEDGNDVYKLYAVIVHVDMLNASFFGHYICYVKDFRGNWYRIDDCKVASVDLDEVLSQGAYMLLYSRIHARPSCLLPTELLRKEESEKVKIVEVDSSMKQHAESSPDAVFIDSPVDSEQSSNNGSGNKVNNGEEFPSTADAEDAEGDTKMASPDISLPIVSDSELHNNDEFPTTPKEVPSTRNNDNEPHLTSTSLIDSTSTELDAKNEASSSASDVEASCGNKLDSNAGSSRMLTEESTTVGNCKDSPDSSTTGNVPAIDTTANAVSDKENSASSTSQDGNIGPGNGLSSSDDTQSSTKKANGGSSAEKCKPLFRPGFFGKQPLRKCVKLDNHTKEVAKSCLLRENGGLLKDRELHITHENGDVSAESDMCKSLENGDSASEYDEIDASVE
ncbi:ubiquitin carboxyl-terminal hydrolase 18-like [Salvia miltiorrhiza]|uniref:ubiquitin carboxyl-terminal hydrolase 18-like n=1 Tax=Salvia miltiorrhiza TaxID=226208 RepID=UPI0025AC4C0C|nr:ubiquitin carboxyl-terminal hydrolase 18-like [Salvia miltiorrhiza]